jgi:hypothetical protein
MIGTAETLVQNHDSLADAGFHRLPSLDSYEEVRCRQQIWTGQKKQTR